MNATRVLRARTPLIQFVGKRTIPESIDHTPRVHPQDPHKTLPSSFAQYREKAQQHGPLTGYRASSSSATENRNATALKPGEYFDRSELPKRFWRLKVSQKEIEAVESGGAAYSLT